MLLALLPAVFVEHTEFVRRPSCTDSGYFALVAPFGRPVWTARELTALALCAPLRTGRSWAFEQQEQHQHRQL